MLLYTLDDLSSIAGIDHETLYSYHEEGLFKSPANSSATPQYGYDSLLALQQIMLYREQSIPVHEIKENLKSEPKELLGRLHDHRLYLLRESHRIHTLIQSVDQTMESLELNKELEPSRLFKGFSERRQREQTAMDTSYFLKKEEVSEVTPAKVKEDYLSSQKTLDTINERLQQAMERGLAPDSEEVQGIIRLHLEWVRQFYTPTAAIYKGLADLYVEQTGYREIYNQYHPGMAEYLRDSMIVLANRELE